MLYRVARISIVSASSPNDAIEEELSDNVIASFYDSCPEPATRDDLKNILKILDNEIE